MHRNDPHTSPILWWPPKNIHIIFMPPKNIHFSQNPKKYWNSEFWTPKNSPSLGMCENIRVPPPPRGISVLLKDHNADTPVKFEPAAPRLYYWAIALLPPTVGAGGYHIMSLFTKIISIEVVEMCTNYTATHVYICTIVSQFPECKQNLFPTLFCLYSKINLPVSPVGQVITWI